MTHFNNLYTFSHTC